MIRIGLVPGRFGRKARLAAALVADELADVFGTKCESYVGREPREIVQQYEEGKLDLLWVSPTLYLRSLELRETKPVAVSVRAGSPHYHGVLFVRRDSSFRTPLDLRGRSVAWVASTSASGYIFPRVALAELGLHPDELFRRQSFVGTHGNVARMVIKGEASCGAGYAHFHDGDMTKGVRAASFLEFDESADIRVLIATPPIPSDFFIARPGLSERFDVGKLLRKASLARPEPFKELFGIDALAAPDHKALERLGKSLAIARELGALD